MITARASRRAATVAGASSAATGSSNEGALRFTYGGSSSSSSASTTTTTTTTTTRVRGSSASGPPNADGLIKALAIAGAVIGAVCLADYAFVGAGGLTWAATPGAAAGRSAAATSATLFSAYLWSKLGGMSSVPGALATCLTYAFGSLLSIVIVQAYKVSATCVLSAIVASAATCAGAWLVRAVAGSSALEPSYYDSDVHAAAMARGAKSFERLEALREVMMREFESEMAELEQKQSQFELEMRKVEERHRKEISRMEIEMNKLRERNTSAAADKAKALEQAKAQHEAEKQRMREQFEKETVLLRETIAKLEADALSLEEKFASERDSLLSQVRAARGLYNAQRAMMFSETEKLKKAISVQEAHAANWHAQVTQIETEKLSLIAKLEAAAKMNDQAQEELVKAIAEVQFEAERELERAIAEALAERQALQLLMNEKEEGWKVELRAAIAEAELKVKSEWEQKVAALEAKHNDAISLLKKEFDGKMQQLQEDAKKASQAAFDAEKATLKATYESSAAAAQKAHEQGLEKAKLDAENAVKTVRAEMAILKATYESAAAAAQSAHARGLDELKQSAARDVEAAKSELVSAVAEQINLHEEEKKALIEELKAEELRMTAELLAEKDAAIGELQKQLKMTKNERRRGV